jgi:hypothetical protein
MDGRGPGSHLQELTVLFNRSLKIARLLLQYGILDQLLRRLPPSEEGKQAEATETQTDVGQSGLPHKGIEETFPHSLPQEKNGMAEAIPFVG